MTDVLFETGDLRVRRVKAGSGDVWFVTFAPLSDVPTLDREGFGEHFFRTRGIDAVHVIARTNVWYHYPEMPRALAAIRAALPAGARVLTYGSSMGGYAAIRFAEAVGAQTAVAMSPQYSIARRLAPFETRWNGARRGIPGISAERAHGSQHVQPVVFYDPRDWDGLHADLVARHYPRTLRAPLPHGGHPVAAMLAETGHLEPTLLDLAAGRFDALDCARRTRALRRRSGQYLFTLARRLRPRHLAWKLSLAEAAAAASGGPPYMVYEAMLREQTGDRAAAEAAYEAALRLQPDQPYMLRALAAFRLRRGEGKLAEPVARRLFDLAPTYESRRLLATALAAIGRTPEARATAGNGWRALTLRLSLSRFAPPFLRAPLQKWRERPFRLQVMLRQVDEWRRRPGIRRARSAL